MPREEKTLVMLHVPLTVQLSDVAMVHVVSAARAASDDVTTNTVSQRPRHSEEGVSRQIIIINCNRERASSRQAGRWLQFCKQRHEAVTDIGVEPA